MKFAFIWSLMTPPGLVKVEKPAPPPNPFTNPFVPGDVVTLKPPNRFKGTLKYGEIYPVMAVAHDHIMLRCDNDTCAYFNFRHFELATIPATAAGADEYDEVMRAEQLMEEGKPP